MLLPPTILFGPSRTNSIRLFAKTNSLLSKSYFNPSTKNFSTNLKMHQSKKLEVSSSRRPFFQKTQININSRNKFYKGCQKDKLFSVFLLPFLFGPIYAEELPFSEEEQEVLLKENPTRFLTLFMDWVEKWILEPIKTLLRFGFLTVNFLPVILTIPVCFMGKRDPNFDNDLTGSLWWYKVLTSRLEYAGATFIKLAQWAASRSDIFPKQLCLTLSKLHSAVEPHSLEETREIIRSAFNGKEIEELFLEFEPNPVGVGAIAQVYRARPRPGLKPKISEGGLVSELAAEARFHKRTVPSYVAIKVLHPRVNKIVERDLRIMKFVADILNWVPTLSWLSLPDEVVTFGEMMRSQLDLRNEAQNLLQLRKNFKGSFTTKFPRPLVDWVSSQVLVERYEFGIPLKYFLQKDTHTPYDLSLSAIGLDSFLHMLVFDNFTHADLHPGNIMVKFYRPAAASFFERLSSILSGKEYKVDDEITKSLIFKASDPLLFEEAIQELYNEGYFPRLVFLDAGLVATLNEVNRKNFLDLFQAIAEFDGLRAGTLMVERCRSPEKVVDGENFAREMEQLILKIKSETFKLSKIDISSILQKVLQMVREHKVRLEGDFINVVISILILEGIGRSLNPELDLFKMALPILRSFGAQGSKEHSIIGLQTMPGGTSWWLKLWFQLEARQILSSFLYYPDPVEQALFGGFKPIFLDI